MSDGDGVAKKAEQNPGAAFLLTSITVITAVFAALGLTGGILGRMARNHSEAAGAALGLALAAIVLGVLAALLDRHQRASRARDVVLALGLLVFLGGGGAAVYAGVQTWLDETRPQVSATVEPTPRGLVLAINAKMNGLKANRRLRVYVWQVVSERWGAVDEDRGDPYSYEVGGLPLHQSVNGPNADGDVDYSVKVPLPPQHPQRVIVQAATGAHRENDCYEKDSRSGCVVLYLGERGRPQLRVGWETLKSGEALAKLRVTAEEVPTATVYVRAFGLRPHGRASLLLAQAHLAPAASGDVNAALDVVAPTSVRALCVVATTLGSAAKTCPPQTKQPERVRRDCLRSFRGPDKPSQAEREASCRNGWATVVERSSGWVRLRVPTQPAGQA